MDLPLPVRPRTATILRDNARMLLVTANSSFILGNSGGGAGTVTPAVEEENFFSWVNSGGIIGTSELSGAEAAHMMNLGVQSAS